MSHGAANPHIDRLRSALGRGRNAPRAPSGLESTGGGGDDAAPITADELHARIRTNAATLHRLVDDYLDASADLHDLVRRITSDGERGLALIGFDNPEAPQVDALQGDRAALGGLEAIIHVDGSRPSFLIRDGAVDRASSPVGGWGTDLDVDNVELQDAVACVGRINDPSAGQGFAGTAFLVADNLVLTNRHVLQAIATPSGSTWTFSPGITIDFGHEYRGIASLNPRTPRRVVFCGPSRITPTRVVHTKLDLALIELDPVATELLPRYVFSVNTASSWHAGSPPPRVYTIGFPGSPAGGSYAPALLEQLFKQTFGYKRLAPGLVANPKDTTAHTWTTAHDCTTLGGNSGSVVVAAGLPMVATALHYAGAPEYENWAHPLAAVLDATETAGGPALSDVLQREGVKLVT